MTLAGLMLVSARIPHVAVESRGRGDGGWASPSPIREPILFLNGASVELAVSITTSATGGVKVWVINAKGGADYERSGKITVQLNTGSEPLGAGM